MPEHVDDAEYADDVVEDQDLDELTEPNVLADIPPDEGDAGPAGVKGSTR